MGKVFSIKGQSGIPFDVHVIDKGDRYGFNDSVLHEEDDPLVIFYDVSVEPSEYKKHGHYASSYYMSTLLEHQENVGLMLDVGIPEYTIEANEMKRVIDHLRFYEQGFSMDSFDREEMKEVAFLYSDYVKEVSDDIDSLGRTPVTLSEFVEHDLQYYVQDALDRNETNNVVHSKIKRKMEFFGYEFEESDEKQFQRASKAYLDMERE